MHVLTGAHTAASLESVGLSGCVRLAAVRDLFRHELQQNWHKLSDRSQGWLRGSLLSEIEGQPHRVEQRSTDDKKCVLNGECSGEEDHWFTEYVSLHSQCMQHASVYTCPHAKHITTA